MEIIKSLVSGAICGAVFSAIGLPVPATQVLPGVMGVFGLFIGYFLVARWHQ